MLILLVSSLVLLWLIGFPTTVGFIAGFLEKRLVWPYSPLEERPDPLAGRRDDDNPYAPPSSSILLPTSDYAEFVNRQALQHGYAPLGTFQNVTSKLYRVRYAFWLSPDRRVLAVVSNGTLAAISLNLTSLVTRTDDGGYIHSVDDFKGLASDPSGLARSDVLSNADFDELLAWHLERVESAPLPAVPYPQDDPLGEHRRLHQFRADRLEERGYARFLDHERQRWKLTTRGAFVAAIRSTLRQYVQRVRNTGRKTIRRPGDAGYVLSAQRSKRGGLAVVLGGLQTFFMIVLVLGMILGLSGIEPRTSAQLLFREAATWVALIGLLLAYVLKRFIVRR